MVWPDEQQREQEQSDTDKFITLDGGVLPNGKKKASKQQKAKKQKSKKSKKKQN